VQIVTKNEVKNFEQWLSAAGAEVLAPTNPYELVRFRAHSAVHIVYSKANGNITANGFAKEAIDHWKKKKPLDMGLVKCNRNNAAKQRAALFKRDGRECFYCGLDMPDDDMTNEHLINISAGGNNRIENMALAHKSCNQLAANLPLIQKIKLREKMRK
jgi:hypothetical protein